MSRFKLASLIIGLLLLTAVVYLVMMKPNPSGLDSASKQELVAKQRELAGDNVNLLMNGKDVQSLIDYSLIPESDLVYEKDDENPYLTYGVALLQLEEEKFRGAITQLKLLSVNYSSVGWYGVSHLLLAYAYFRTGEYNLTIQHAQDFLALSPDYRSADFVQYMIAASYYKMTGDLQDTADNVELSMFAYQELLNNYPESEYAAEAELRIQKLESFLVEKTMVNARWYQRQRESLAALNLFMRVINDHPLSVQAPEAYYRVGEIFYQMGADQEAKKFFERLSEEHPDTMWENEGQKLLAKIAD